AAEGETLAVEVALVPEGRLACETGDVGEELGHRDGEAEVDERLGDPPVADPEGPVAGHPGDHALAWVDDREVVEPRHVDPVADELGQLVDRLRLSARDGEGEGERAVVAEKRRRRVPGRNPAVAGLCSGLAIPDDPARDALRHELDPPPRTALEVEGLWQPARVERVVRDRD